MDGGSSNLLAILLWCVCLYWTATPFVASAGNRNGITLASLGQEDTLLYIASLGGNSTRRRSHHLCQPASIPRAHTSDCLVNATSVGPVRSEPQFGTTVQRKADIINNSTTILPAHQIQLLHNLVSPTQLLDYLRVENSRRAQLLIILNFITCFSENVLFELLEETQSMAPEALFLYRTEQDHLTYDKEPTSVTKQQLNFLAQYDGPFFFPYPTPSDLYEAVLTFVHQMGWRRVVFIFQCRHPLKETVVAHLQDWAQFKRSETILSHSSNTMEEADIEALPHRNAHSLNFSAELHSEYVDTPVDQEGDVFALLQDLDVLELVHDGRHADVLQTVHQNERRIIIFTGELCEYLDLLVEAHKKLLYGPG